MKVTINDVVLADHGVQSVDGFSIDGGIVSQEVQFPRAAEITLFNRYNRKTDVSFSSVRLFASVELAEIFMLEHASGTPDQGTVMFEAKNGGNVIRRYLKNAMCKTVRSSYHGCTTFHSYQISGGKILTTKP